LITTAACRNSERSDKPADTTSKETELIRLADSNPDSAMLKENLLQYYREAGNYDKAIAYVNGVISKDSINPRWWDIKGTLHIEDADTVNAIRSYENAIAIFPDPQYVMSLGILYAQTKNNRSLEMADALLVSKAKAEKEAYFIKGIYFSAVGDKKKALGFFDQCLKESYTYMPAYIEKSIILYDIGQVEDALAVLDKAVTLQNNFEEGYFYRGRCLEKLNRIPEAIESYQQALYYDPSYPEAKDALSRLGIKN